MKSKSELLKEQIEYEKKIKEQKNNKKIIYYPEGEVHIIRYEEPSLCI